VRLSQSLWGTAPRAGGLAGPRIKFPQPGRRSPAPTLAHGHHLSSKDPEVPGTGRRASKPCAPAGSPPAGAHGRLCQGLRRAASVQVESLNSELGANRLAFAHPGRIGGQTEHTGVWGIVGNRATSQRRRIRPRADCAQLSGLDARPFLAIIPRPKKEGLLCLESESCF
jgi:hypothetical protein